ncbi:MAG: DUF5050 domain-containing protein [Lachnospira sp.]
MRKTIKIIPLIMIFALMLASCGKNGQNEKKKISLDGNDSLDITQSYFSGGAKTIAKAEGGYYYIDDSLIPSPLAYYDNALGKSVYLCDLPNCSHKYVPKTGTDCKAYLTGYACEYLMYSDETLYAACSDNNKIDLFAMDKDGNNRRLISTLLYTEYVPEMAIYNGYIYYGELCNQTSSEESEISIYKMSLSGGNAEKIYTFRGNEPEFSNFKIYGDDLYFTQSSGSVNFAKKENNIKIDGLNRINLENNENTKVLDEPVFNYSIDMESKKVFYSVEGKGLFCYDVKTDQTTTYYEATEQFDRIKMTFDGDYLYFENTAWVSYAYYMFGYNGLTNKLIVMDPNGNIVNEIELPNTTLYVSGGDKSTLFINADGKTMYAPKESLINKKNFEFMNLKIDKE